MKAVLARALVIALLVGVLPAGAAASNGGAIADLPGCGSSVLDRNDDGSTDLVPFGFPVNFFGAGFDHLYVNNNGNVTFTAPLWTFTPEPIGSGGTGPIIAPFWADVDTRHPDSAVVTYGATEFGGRPAFCVNWDGVGVGYYRYHVDKLNKFQLLLIDRSDVGVGDFDIIFNYEQIQWETGDASNGSGGLGGNSARAGYSNGAAGTQGISLELPGSAVNGAFLDTNSSTGLIHNSRNSTILGRYVFPVRNGQVPTGNSVSGVVRTNPPVAGAFVQACRPGLCLTTVSSATGTFAIAGLAPGDYALRAYPPAGSRLDPSLPAQVEIVDQNLTGLELVLTGPVPPPPDVTISGPDGDPVGTTVDGIPRIFAWDTLTLEKTGQCASARAWWEVRQGPDADADGLPDVVRYADPGMTESPAGSGHLVDVIPPFSSLGISGIATTVVYVDCPPYAPPYPGAEDSRRVWTIYIDPSGNVRTASGSPVAGATVTLYRSDSGAPGSFVAVPDGSFVMAPSNRTNPDLTNGAGHFGWDVVAGFYIVRAEKADCTALDGGPYAETAVLEVPPEVTDLDLRLTGPGCPDASDTTSPVTSATKSPPANAAGWNHSAMTVELAASDEAGGSGVLEIRYSVDGGAVIVSTGASTSIAFAADAVHTITYWAVDNAGNAETPQVIEVKIDLMAPLISCSATPAQLWPPNHKLIGIAATATASDGGSGVASLALTGATSSEADAGLGPDDVPGDIQGWTLGTLDLDGQLRAERYARGGRTYSLTYTATDAAGHTASCTTTVSVPHDRRASAR